MFLKWAKRTDVIDGNPSNDLSVVKIKNMNLLKLCGSTSAPIHWMVLNPHEVERCAPNHLATFSLGWFSTSYLYEDFDRLSGFPARVWVKGRGSCLLYFVVLSGKMQRIHANGVTKIYEDIASNILNVDREDCVFFEIFVEILSLCRILFLFSGLWVILFFKGLEFYCFLKILVLTSIVRSSI